MKKVILGFIILVLLAAIGVGVWYILTPHTPEQHHARLLKRLGKVPPGDVEGFQRMVGEYEVVERRIEECFPDSTLRDVLAFERVEIVDRLVGDATGALPMYETFVQQFPSSEKAAAAHYRIGEIFLQQKKYLQALDSFREVTLRFPEHALADEAQYQVGMIFNEIDENEAALRELRQLVDKYPDSPLAPKAQLKVADILSEKLKRRRQALQELQKLQITFGGTPEATTAGAVEQSLGEEVSQEDVQDYQRERYQYPPPDHTQRWQDEREEAIQEEILAQGLDIEHYELEVVLAPSRRTIQVRAVMTFQNGSQPSGRVTLRLGPQITLKRLAQAQSPRLPAEDAQQGSSGTPLEFKHEEGLLACRFPGELPPGERVSLYLEYEGRWANRAQWKGDVIDAASGYLRAESQWYPYTAWGDTATYQAVFHIPKPYQVIATGVLEEQKVEQDRQSFAWKANQPFFGITVAYGHFAWQSREVTLGRRVVPVRCYTRPEHLGQASALLDEAESILQFYSERFCPFPYDSLKIVEMPPFPGGYGGCTLVLLTSRAFEGQLPRWLLAHELAHQWWGNLVGITLAESSIPWLTEGFATYSDILYTEHRGDREHLHRHLLKYAGLYYDHASYGTDEAIRTANWRSPMYQAITYQKGSLVLHALRYVMGDRAFFQALREYATRFSFSAATVEDFRRVCEEFYEPEPESPGYPEDEWEKPSLHWFFEEWLERPGFPILRIDTVEATPAESGYDLEIVILQDEFVYRIPIDLLLSSGEEKRTERVWMDMPNSVITLEQWPWKPEAVKLDPEGWILKDPKPDYVHWSASEDN